MFFEYDGTMLAGFNKRIYSRPGIYQITCLANNKALIGESENAYQFVRDCYDNLKLGICENKQLLDDFHKYDREDFTFDVLSVDYELEDPQIRKEMLEKIKNEYKYEYSYESTDCFY